MDTECLFIGGVWDGESKGVDASLESVYVSTICPLTNFPSQERYIQRTYIDSIGRSILFYVCSDIDESEINDRYRAHTQSSKKS